MLQFLSENLKLNNWKYYRPFDDDNAHMGVHQLKK